MSVNDMQEWILLLQKLVQDLENSKLLLLCKKRSLECRTRLRLGQQHPGNQCKCTEDKNFYPSLSMLMNQKNPFLHCIFQTANLYSFCFYVPGQGKHRAEPRRPAAGWLVMLYSTAPVPRSYGIWHFLQGEPSIPRFPALRYSNELSGRPYTGYSLPDKHQ